MYRLGVINQCKKRLAKKDGMQRVNAIYTWVKTDVISQHEFIELMNHIHMGMTNSSYDKKRGKYTGTEDPEYTLG